MSLVIRIGTERSDLSIHGLNVRSKLFAVVFKLLQSYLKCGSLIVPLKHLFLGLSNGNLADFILLLQVDNELVLSLDNGFILSHFLLSLFHLVLIADLHVGSEVGQSVDFFVKTCDLAVFLNNEFV